MAKRKSQTPVDSDSEQGKANETQARDSEDNSSQGNNREVSEGANLPYIEFNFHNDEDWLKWRMSHIGGSEIAATMHKCPWMTRLTLMRTKLGMEPKVKPNAAMARGSMLEETVRQMCESRLKQRLPSKTLQSKKYPHLVAQIDGLGVSEQIEIKCPYSEIKFSEMAKEIPLHYKLQMQHQMIVSGRESVVFCLYFELFKVVSISILSRYAVSDFRFFTPISRRFAASSGSE